MANTWFEVNAPTEPTDPTGTTDPYTPPREGGFTGVTLPTPVEDPVTTAPATTPATTPASSTSTLPSVMQNQYTNPTFVAGKINEGFQQLYGRNATDAEMAQWQKYMLTPDIFSDGKTRVGWNPYWQDRLLRSNSGPYESSYSNVPAGDETIVSGQWGGTTGTVGNYGTGSYTGGGQYPLASVMGTGLMQPWTTPFEGGANFQAPTDVTQQNDPGWQFRMKEGLKAIERSAASKGTLLTGGTLKDLNNWAQNTASNEYGNVYNRAATEWERNYNRNLGEYNNAYNIYNTNQGNQFNRLNSMSTAGLSAAGGANQNNSQYGTNTSEILTGQGNATAAGQVGSANALTSGVSDIGKTIQDFMSWYATRPKTTTTPTTVPTTGVSAGLTY
jgi:hypothetical protein